MSGLVARVRRNRLVARALEVQRRYDGDRGGYLAATIAYYGFLSLFPLMLVGASVLGFMLAGAPGIRADLIERLSRSIPGLGSAIGDNLDSMVRGRAAAGAVGLIGLLWTGTGMVQAAGYALERIGGGGSRRTARKDAWYRSMVRDRVWAIGSTLLLGVLAVAGVGLAAVAPAAGGAAGVALAVAAGTGAFAVDVVAFVLAFRVLIRGPSRPLAQLFPGALFAAGGWTLLKLVGAWYVARTVARSSAVYGTFASTIGVLILLYLAARLFVYGAELNEVLGGRRAPSLAPPAAVRPAETPPRARLGARRTG